IQQRWGMYLLQTLILPQTIYPFTTAALSILFLALSSVVFARRTGLPTTAQAVFCLLFVSFPTFAHIQCFAYMGPHVAVAILLVVLAEKLFASTGPGREGLGKLW